MENVIQAFLRTVAEQGHEPAVSDTNGTFTYSELYEYSIAVAANLKKNGVGHGSRIIVEIPRSKEYAACLIGCWLIGAVTIPLSDDYPEDRLAYIKKDSQYQLSIDEAFVNAMDLSLRTEPVIPDYDDEGVVIYTSGSTGNPKGVVHDFAGMSAAAFRNVMHDKSEKAKRNNTAGLIAPFTFIVGMSQLLATLALAKHLVIISDEIRRDPFKLAAYYDENNILLCTAAAGGFYAQAQQIPEDDLCRFGADHQPVFRRSSRGRERLWMHGKLCRHARVQGR